MKSTTILLVILLSFLLVVRLFFHFAERTVYQEGDKVNITHSFLQEPRKNEFGQYFFTSNLLVTLPSYPRYHYGEKVKIEGTVSIQDSERGELRILKNPRITLISNDNIFINLAKSVRKGIEKAVITTIPSKEAGLLLGIILGVRDRIDSEFYEDLRDTGVLHIIAASGQNVSILASILLVTLATFVKRKLAILFTALFILFYSVLTGFDPPIVRASIMALLSFGAMILGRQSTGLFTLAVTGWLMVFMSPDLIEDVSFQLSFLSTFGIITVKPILDSLINLRKLNVIKEDLNTTVSAQISTIPLMLMTFGNYSLLSLPVNILVLWTVPIIMLSGVMALFVSTILPFLAKPLILISFPFVFYFTQIIDLFAGIKLNFQASGIPMGLYYGYYLILIAIVIKFRKRERGKI